MIRLFAVLGLLLLALPLQLRAQGADPIADYRATLSRVEDALNEDFAPARARGLLIALPNFSLARRATLPLTR